MSDPRAAISHSRLGALLVCAASVACMLGCNKAKAPTAPSLTAAELLERMQAAYRQAPSYEDSGTVRVNYTIDGRPQEGVADFSVTFERPNKLRLHLYQAIVVSDGQKSWATIQDLPAQVLERPAPEEISFEWLFSDSALAQTLASGMAGGAPQLGLLLVDEPFQPIVAQADDMALVAERTIDDATCQGVRIKTKNDTLTLWIDAKNYLLRRIEFDGQSPIGQVERMRYTSDFAGARLGGKIDSTAFRFELPEGAKIVSAFDARQAAGAAPPRPPSDLLGRKAPAFRFTTLDGQPVTNDSLTGKVVVLDFWATWSEPSVAALADFGQVVAQFKDDPNVAMFAVNIDDSRVTNEAIRQTAAKLGLESRVLRDLDESWRDVFKVEEVPNLYLISATAVVEDQEVGLNPNLAAELPERINKVLAGESTFELARRRFDERRRAYERVVALSETPIVLPLAKITPRGEPTSHTLTKLWSTADLKQPGNILVVDGSGGARLMVNDGLSAVGELNAAGQLVTRHELKLPSQREEAIVSYLRTAKRPDGSRIFAGTAGGRQQVHLFNDKFEVVGGYPDIEAEGTHAGIADVRLADLDGDGQIEQCVAFYGLVGVQAVSLEGKRVWWSRGLENIFRLAVVGPDASGKRLLLCSHLGGTLVVINSEGQAGQPIVVADRYIRAVEAVDLNGDSQPELCAIAARAAGEDTLVGLDTYAKERWSYALPSGVQHVPSLEMLTGGPLTSRAGQWVAAGADGSIHILAADGVLVDRFNYGAAISGLAVAELDGQPALIVAADGKVEAWRVAKE